MEYNLIQKFKPLSHSKLIFGLYIIHSGFMYTASLCSDICTMRRNPKLPGHACRCCTVLCSLPIAVSLYHFGQITFSNNIAPHVNQFSLSLCLNEHIQGQRIQWNTSECLCWLNIIANITEL